LVNPPRKSPIAECAPAGAGLRVQAGVGFKPQHFEALQADPTPPGFVEVHAENYMGAGGVPHAQLSALRERLPVSLHGVGLSIGGEEPLDSAHLERLARLNTRYQPMLFSEHLAWSTHGGRYFNDLLPVCYDSPALVRVCAHIDQLQSRMGRQILLENPSTYFEFESSSYCEPDFLAAIVQRTGCGLLLDVNNVYVSCHNNRHNPLAYLAALPLHAVKQIHLAGHAEERDLDGDLLLIDDHGAPVAEAVWALYALVVAKTGPIATLIEWDTRVPAYSTLRGEAQRAQRVQDEIAVAAKEIAA
jgi:hypothetical protein